MPPPHGYGLVESTRTIVVPYEGLIDADPESGAVYRIELKCDIPEDSEYKQLELMLDFKPAGVSGREFVLPSHFHLHTLKVVRDVSETISDADYKQYRRFTADSTVKYDQQDDPYAG